MMVSFSFNFQQPKGSRYFLFGALVFILFMLLGILIENMVFFVVGIISVIIGFALYITKAQDSITMDDNGFTSTYYGRIDYGDIKSIPPLGFFSGMPPPSMKMILASGRKIVWQFDINSDLLDSNADALAFNAFTDELLVRLQQFKGDSGLSSILQKQQVIEDIPATPAGHNSEQPAAHVETDPAAQLLKAKEKGVSSIWAIPIGLVLAIGTFARRCNANHKDDELNNMFSAFNKQYKENDKMAKHAFYDHLKKLGPVYLYTNDTAVTVRLLPAIREHEFGQEPWIMQRVKDNEEAERMIHHPDSIAYLTVLCSRDGKVFEPMQKSMLNRGDSTDTFLYLRLYDSTLNINSGSSKIGSSGFIPLDIRTAVSISKYGSVAQSLEQAIPGGGIDVFLSDVNRPSTLKVYLTGAAKDHITESLFDKAVQKLNKMLRSAKAGTALFKKTVYNREN